MLRYRDYEGKTGRYFIVEYTTNVPNDPTAMRRMAAYAGHVAKLFTKANEYMDSRAVNRDPHDKSCHWWNEETGTYTHQAVYDVEFFHIS